MHHDGYARRSSAFRFSCDRRTPVGAGAVTTRPGFFVLEDLRSAETLSGTPFAGLIDVLDEDLLFVDDVIHKLTDPKVSFTNCFAQLAFVANFACQVEDRVTRRRTGKREVVCQMAKVSGAVHAFVPRRDEARSVYLCPHACGIALV